MNAIACWGLSQLWSAASATARAASHAGLLRSRRLPSKVISVGNIQAGGSGKTPLVARIAREGLQRGLSVCILSRGYGGEWERDGGATLAPKQVAPASQCGDEVALLRDLVPEAWIGVGARRGIQYDRVVERMGRAPDLVILDDGFQHWRIFKDVEVVALTSRGPAEIPYRDWYSALGRANLVVWTKGEARPSVAGGAVARVRFTLRAPGEGERYWLVTALADNDSARGSLQAVGWEIARHMSFADHAAYDEEGVRKILADAKQAGCKVLLTGKDWVKWRDLGVAPSQVEVIEPSVEIVEGESQWRGVLWGDRA